MGAGSFVQALCCSPVQFVEGDRKLAYPFSCCVVDRIGDRRRDRDDADLSHAVDTEGLMISSGSSTKITLMSRTSR